MTESVFTDTFIEKELTLGTGLGAEKVALPCWARAGNAHDEHVCTTEFGDISQFLDAISFRVDAAIGVAGSATSRSIAIGGDGEDLAALDKDGHMEAVANRVAGEHALCSRILKKLFHQSVEESVSHRGTWPIGWRICLIFAAATAPTAVASFTGFS